MNLPVVKILVFAFTLFTLFTANPSQRAFSQELIKKELEIQKQRLQTLEKEIEQHRQKAKEVEKGKKSILQELEDLNNEIARQWKLLTETKKEWTRKELELVEARKQLKSQQQHLEQQKKYIQSRLSALREMGTVGTLNVLFAAESLPELMSRETYLKFLLQRDQEKRKEYLERLKELERRQQMLDQEKKALEQQAEQIERQALALEEKRQERRAFLDELKQQSKRYQKMIAELEIAQMSLKDIIKKLSEGARQQGIFFEDQDHQSFANQRALLVPPVIGPVKRAYLSGTQAPGILIQAPWGSEIRTIFDGMIAFSGELKGYGKVIVIDHQDGYLSLVAQASEIFKREGEEVKEGDIIGLVGGGPWIEEGIYFELRYKNKYLDPMKWLDLRGVKVENGISH